MMIFVCVSLASEAADVDEVDGGELVGIDTGRNVGVPSVQLA